MLQKHPERFGLAAMLAVILAIPFLRAQKLSMAVMRTQVMQPQNEVFSSQATIQAEAQAEAARNAELAAAVTPEPECTFFKNFPQYSAMGSAGLQRVNTFDAEAIRHLSDVSTQTVEVAQGLAQTNMGKQPSLAAPWVSRIDSYVFPLLQQKNIAPAPLTTDEEFLRRVTIDLIGRIPASDQVEHFLADTNPQKRSAAIERLLNSPEWVDRWTMWLGDLLQNSSAGTQINRGTPGRDALYQYIKTSLQYNKPYNVLASELMTGSGDSYVSGPANFIVGGTMSMGPVQDTYDRQWVQAATMFLGIKHFDCLLCHNGAGHLDSINLWASGIKRSQAWGMAAFYSRARITRPMGATWTVAEAATGGYNLNTTSGNRPTRAPIDGLTATVLPKYIFTGQQLTAKDNYRVVLANDVTHDMQFARAAVNYVWAHFFTIGIVDPPDAFDLARLDPRNPPPAPWTLQPSNPALLDELAHDFINSGYDLKDLMRQITNSQTYQLSSRYNGTWDVTDAPYFPRHLIRRLESEELADSVVQSSGVANNMNITLGSGSTTVIPWAMQLPETITPRGAVGSFLDTFLRGDRDANPRRSDLSTSEALALMNDNFVISRVRSSTASGGKIFAMLNSTANNTTLIQWMYQDVLSRNPTQDELNAELARFQSGTRANNAQDLLWTLYNKVDFVFNY